ncbi:MAG TPA: LamG-like jellyroll fold domain-containing protein, partial [Actinomycetota bacterium]|nr:LamG-like jellyroll fold domain-containing protein [Actinomycetota bacterium]
LYALSQGLSFYPAASGGTGFTANAWKQVVVTRDSSDNVTGYLDGTQVLTFVDSSNYGVVANDLLQFFVDNQTGNAANREQSAGAVARMRFYDDALSSSEVSGLDRLPSAAPVSGESSTPVCGSETNDTIQGSEEDDTIYAGEGDDTINGGGGDDVIIGAGGNDVINGGDGDDVIIGDEESDTPEAAAGYPLLGAFLQEEPPAPPGNDTLDGGLGNDVVDGDAGDDTVKGGGGADSVEGGEGKDKVTGQAGADTLSGSAGPDNLNGGGGVDGMNGGGGKDTCVLDSKKERSRTASCERKKLNFKRSLPSRFLWI